jgi:hypothetical protein
MKLTQVCCSNVLRVFNEGGGRYYQLEGVDRPLPSVTSILSIIDKPGLGQWQNKVIVDELKRNLWTSNHHSVPVNVSSEHFDDARRQAQRKPREILTTSGQFGTKAHLAIEYLMRGDEVPAELVSGSDSTTMKSLIGAFHRWHEQSQFSFVESERVVYSQEHGYAGAVDAIGYRLGDNGQCVNVVLDWKTSNRVYDTYALQLAAYARAFEEREPGSSIGEAWVLRYDRARRQFEASRIESIDHSFDAFLGALRLWRAFHCNHRFFNQVL